MALHSSSRKQLLLDRARFMRHHPTYSEALLWSAIRGQRFGVQFRRQQVIGEFIVDFLARKASLVVEVDGDVLHAYQAVADARRDEKLRRAGYRLLRIPASVVEKELVRAVELVREALEGRRPSFGLCQNAAHLIRDSSWSLESYAPPSPTGAAYQPGFTQLIALRVE